MNGTCKKGTRDDEWLVFCLDCGYLDTYETKEQAINATTIHYKAGCNNVDYEYNAIGTVWI